MKEEKITRTYLETLSFSDLVTLADDYGVDVPDDLDRRFLIAELLEIAEETANYTEEMIISSDNESGEEHVLSGNYNETQVSCILRNPAWLFVFWNVNNTDAEKIKEAGSGSLKLRICILEDDSEDSKLKEVFEIQSSTTSQEQYVLIPKGTEYIKVELILITENGTELLAFSPVVNIPQGASIVNDLQLGRDSNFPPIIELSGINEILTEHYKKHRHSFS